MNNKERIKNQLYLKNKKKQINVSTMVLSLHDNVYGDFHNVYSDVSGIRGDVSNICGNGFGIESSTSSQLNLVAEILIFLSYSFSLIEVIIFYKENI